MRGNRNFFTQFKAVPVGFFKRIHSLVRDGTDREQVNTIQRELEFGIAGHVAYAGCAAGSNGSRGIWD